MRKALGPGALGRPGGSGWRGRWEGGSGWGRHVNSKKKEKKKKKNKAFTDPTQVCLPCLIS